MKHFFIHLSVLLLVGLTSCSDVNDNSFLTNPIMEKAGASDAEIVPAPVYPYPYLFNFTEVKGIKYTTVEGENAVDFFITDEGRQYSQIFVVIKFPYDANSRVIFVDQIEDKSFKVEGITTDQIGNLEVYALDNHNINNETVSPFPNNTVINELSYNNWKISNGDIVVEWSGVLPSSVKFVFAEIQNKGNNYFLFIQKPVGSTFRIPQYGKYGAESVTIFGYQTVMESIARY